MFAASAGACHSCKIFPSFMTTVGVGRGGNGSGVGVIIGLPVERFGGRLAIDFWGAFSCETCGVKGCPVGAGCVRTAVGDKSGDGLTDALGKSPLFVTTLCLWLLQPKPGNAITMTNTPVIARGIVSSLERKSVCKGLDIFSCLMAG